MAAFLFVTKGARHAATARLGMPVLQTHLVEKFFFGEKLADFLVVQRVERLLMAMPVNERLAVEPRRDVVRRWLRRKSLSVSTSIP